ncbi:unnamed protein product, partial [Pocillopora meandrina]
SCCLNPDKCYDKLKRSKNCLFRKGVYMLCPTQQNEIIPHDALTSLKIKKGLTLLSYLTLEPASYYWFWGKCRYRLCECDAVATKCFKISRYQIRREDTHTPSAIVVHRLFL